MHLFYANASFKDVKVTTTYATTDYANFKKDTGQDHCHLP